MPAGEIRIGDAHPQHARPRLAYVPQRHSVDWDFPITVRGVVEQGRYPSLSMFRRLGRPDHDRIDAALEELGISDLAERQIRMLSGGQQQRVFLARAVAQGGDIFLLDEPFAGLDLFGCEELTHILRNWAEQGRTVLAAVHDLAIARSCFEPGRASGHIPGGRRRHRGGPLARKCGPGLPRRTAACTRAMRGTRGPRRPRHEPPRPRHLRRSRYEFMRRGLLSALLLGVSGGMIGCVLVLRRLALMGDALSHSLLPGVAVAWYFFGTSTSALFFGGLAAGLLTALGSALLSRLTRVKEDAAFGSLFIVFFGAGVALVSKLPTRINLTDFLFGNVLGVSAGELRLAAAVSLLTVAVFILFYRSVLLETFDPVFHRATGGHGGLVHLGFLTLTVLNLVAAMQTMGIVLALGLFLLPAVSAYLWCDRFITMLLVSIGDRRRRFRNRHPCQFPRGHRERRGDRAVPWRGLCPFGALQPEARGAWAP